MDTITGSFKRNPQGIYKLNSPKKILNENSDDDLSLDESYDSTRHIPAIDSLDEILQSMSAETESQSRISEFKKEEKRAEVHMGMSQSSRPSKKSVHFANGLVQVSEIPSSKEQPSRKNQEFTSPRLSLRMERKILSNMKEDLVFSPKLATSTVRSYKNKTLSPPLPPKRVSHNKEISLPTARKNGDKIHNEILDRTNRSRNTQCLQVSIPQEFEGCDHEKYSPTSSRRCECCKLISPPSRISPSKENQEITKSMNLACPTSIKPFKLLTEERAELRKLVAQSNLDNMDESEKYQFKALPMPDFAYLHSKFNISREKTFTITEPFDFELDKRFNGRSPPKQSQDDTNVGRYRFQALRVPDFTFRPLGSSHDIHLNMPVPAHLILDGKLASRVTLTSTRGQSNLLDDNDVIDFIRNVHMSHTSQQQKNQIQVKLAPQSKNMKSPPKMPNALSTTREKKYSPNVHARLQTKSSPGNRSYMSPTQGIPSFSESPRSFTAKKIPDFSKPFIPKKPDRPISSFSTGRSPSPSPSRSKVLNSPSPSSKKGIPSFSESPRSFTAKKMPDFSKPFTPKKPDRHVSSFSTGRSPSPSPSRSKVLNSPSPSSKKGIPSFLESPRSFTAKKMPDFSKPFTPKKPSFSTGRSPSPSPSRSKVLNSPSPSPSKGTPDKSTIASPGFKAKKMPDFSKPFIPKKPDHNISTNPVTANKDCETVLSTSNASHMSIPNKVPEVEHETTKNISQSQSIDILNEADKSKSIGEENRHNSSHSISNESSSSISKMSSLDHHSNTCSSLGKDGDSSSESLSSSYSSGYDSNEENEERKDESENDLISSDNRVETIEETSEPLIKVMERLNKTIERLNEMESKTIRSRYENPNLSKQLDDITSSNTNQYTERERRAYTCDFGDDFSSELTNLFRGGISRGPIQPDFVMTKNQEAVNKEDNKSLSNISRKERNIHLLLNDHGSFGRKDMHSFPRSSSLSVEEKVNQILIRQSLEKPEMYDNNDAKRRLPALHTHYSMVDRKESSILDRFMYCCTGKTEHLTSPRMEEWRVSQDREDEQVSM